MEWKCSRCQTENSGTYICKACGFDKSRDYVRYGSIAVLQGKDKARFKKMFMKGDNILMACPDITSVFGRTMDRRKIKSIQIYNTLSLADELAWDVSAHKDGSVLAWVTEDKEGWKHLYLAANGKIIANENCGFLFSDYYNAEYIKGLQYFDTRNVTDMKGMFQWCHNLQELDLSGFNTKKVVCMNRLFSHCNSLRDLDLSSFNTRNVTDMRRLFENCDNLQELNLSSFDTGNVTNTARMFYECNSLQELNLSNFNTKNVTYMVNMFAGCHNLQELDLSSFDTENVTNMLRMFSECSGLQELDLSNFDTKKVKNTKNMFYNCNKLKKVHGNILDMRNIGLDRLMKTEKIFDEAKAVIVKQLEVSETSVTMEASFIDDLGADSLDLVELVMDLEKKFDIEIPDGDAEKFVTVGDVIDYIQESDLIQLHIIER